MKPTFTAAAALLVAFTATACSTTADPESTEPGDACPVVGFAVPYDDVDPCSAEAVLHAAVSAVFGYRPAEDTDPGAAFTRARPLIRDVFAAPAEHAAGVWAPITTALWQRWRDHRAPVTTTVMITGDDHPADTVSSADRVLAVRVQPAHEPVVEFTVYASAARTPEGPWLLSGLGVRS